MLYLYSPYMSSWLRQGQNYFFFFQQKENTKKFALCETFLSFLRQNPTNAIIYVNIVLFTLLHYFIFQHSKDDPQGALVHYVRKWQLVLRSIHTHTNTQTHTHTKTHTNTHTNKQTHTQTHTNTHTHKHTHINTHT